MQRGQKSIETFPNMDQAWFALVEQRLNDKRRWRRFAHNRVAAYVEMTRLDAAIQSGPLTPAEFSTKQ
jgi:hypothetical protein